MSTPPLTFHQFRYFSNFQVWLAVTLTCNYLLQLLKNANHYPAQVTIISSTPFWWLIHVPRTVRSQLEISTGKTEKMLPKNDSTVLKGNYEVKEMRLLLMQGIGLLNSCEMKTPPDLYSICNFVLCTHSTPCTRKKMALVTPKYLKHGPLCQILIQIKYFCTSTCAGKQGSRNSSMCQPLSLPASKAGGKATARWDALQGTGTAPCQRHQARGTLTLEAPCRATDRAPPLASRSPAMANPHCEKTLSKLY